MAIRRTISLSLAIVVLIIFIVGQGSFWVWFLFYQKDHHEKLLKEEMSSLGQYLAREARGPVAEGDVAELESLLGGLVLFDGVISASVADAGGTELAIRVFTPQGDSGNSGNFLYIPAANRLTLNVAEGENRLGQINLTYSGRSVNDYMSSLATLTSVIEGIVVLLIICGIFLYLDRNVGKPFGLMQQRIKQVTDGDLSVEFPDYGGNEIGVISKGLNFLVRELRGNISRINETTKSLVMPIVKLSTTFENVTREIKKQFDSTSSIAGSLKQVSGSYREITASTERLSEFSSDNVSFLLEVKSTSEEIVSNTNKLFDASEESYSVVAEMSQTSKTVAQNSRDVLFAVEETLASVEQLRASVKEVEANAEESAELAARVRAMAAENGTLIVANAIEGMENISDKVRQAVDMVDKLGVRSGDVQKMLSVIREVTEQTNLLSLNAAILAEQAGEYGKGFAVVADEMRALSDRTAESTKDIGGVVKTIQAEIKDAVVTIKDGMEMVNKGHELVYKVGESMGQVLEAAQESSRMADTIKHATKEQAGSLDLVTNQMINISSMASNMSSVMAEQQNGSEHMLERVGEVREIAEISKRSTEEQASGTATMSKNVELANSKISDINAATLEQQQVTENIISSLDEIKNLGETILEHVEAMSEPLQTLTDEIHALKKAMDSFKVS